MTNGDPSFIEQMLSLLDQQTTLLCQPHTQERDIAIINTTREITLTLKSFHEANTMLDLIRSHHREQADPSALLSSGS